MMKPFMALLLLFVMQAVLAADQEKAYLLTPEVYKQLTVAQGLMEKNKNKQAEGKLNQLLSGTEKGSYDAAVVQQTLAYLYASQEQYKKASSFFRSALNGGALPKKVNHNLRHNLAQILLAEGQYKEGTQLLEKWLKSEKKPSKEVYVLLASAYYQIKQYQRTADVITKAIKREKRPPESWYQMLLSARLELKQYSSATKILEQLINRYPEKEAYWTQLAALYQQQNKLLKALAVKKLTKDLNLSDNRVVWNLADMYRYLSIPYKSAQLLEKSLKAGVLTENQRYLTRLADSWIAAQELTKAAAVLNKLVKRSAKGEDYLKYGRILFRLEQWPKAESNLKISIRKLTGNARGQALLLLGMTYVYQFKLEQAKTQFSKAMTVASQRKQASQWLQHIDAQLSQQTQ